MSPIEWTTITWNPVTGCDRVQDYQKEKGISGIERGSKTIRGESLTYWDKCDQLVQLPSDLEVLKSQVNEIVSFFSCGDLP